MQRSSLPRHRWVRYSGLALAMCVCAAVQGQESTSLHPRTDEPRRFVVERSLSPGGALDLVVNAGDVRIVRNLQPGKIRLQVEIMSPQLDSARAQQRWVKRIEVEGSHASIDLQLPTGRSAGLVTIYVPPVTSLVVKLHAGRLTVGGVKGDKDLRVGSGMLTLRETDASEYQHVRADVHLGELTDDVFHVKQNGLWGRRLIVEGKGRYQLLLHVGTGDLVLTGEDGP